jgi:cell division septum initiation protein DivIVA
MNCREVVTFSCGYVLRCGANLFVDGGTIVMAVSKSTALADVQRGLEDDLCGSGRGEVATLRRAPDNESEVVANNLGAILQRVAGSSLQEIDRLVSELQSIRDLLETEGARVQREIAEYAHLSQSSIQSTKIIAESLAHWRNIADQRRA